MLNDDYKDMLQCLSAEGVRFLVVGAYALAVHGFPRATKDIDFFVCATPDNADDLMRAIARFGTPIKNLSAADFATEGTVFHIGTDPRRIDILTCISGVIFEQAYGNRLTVSMEGIDVPVISLKDLIANKRARGRTQDLADVERLEALKKSTGARER
jgi:predicted nucleotidyltransferase